MGLNQNMNLVLSTDAKPRLKWTSELHQCFLEAVSQLGGPEKATPKSLMRAMGVPGLTLYHLKSHLQKHRMGKVQITESSIDNNNNKQEDESEVQSQNMNHNQNNECLHISEAWRMQVEVQWKLQEQIKVQRHLQLRIEAQGKYLQSVIKKAQETLAGYSSSSSAVGVEHTKTELSHLVSMVSSGCPSSSLSELTEAGEFRSTIHSMESSLTSSESDEAHKNDSTCTELPLMDIFPSNAASWRKRNADLVSDDQSGMLDLNRQYQNDADSGPGTIDLNTRA